MEATRQYTQEVGYTCRSLYVLLYVLAEKSNHHEDTGITSLDVSKKKRGEFALGHGKMGGKPYVALKDDSGCPLSGGAEVGAPARLYPGCVLLL